MEDNASELYAAWQYLREGVNENRFTKYRDALYKTGKFSSSFRRGMPKDVVFKTNLHKISILPFITQVYTV